MKNQEIAALVAEFKAAVGEQYWWARLALQRAVAPALVTEAVRLTIG